MLKHPNKLGIECHRPWAICTCFAGWYKAMKNRTVAGVAEGTIGKRNHRSSEVNIRRCSRGLCGIEPLPDSISAQVTKIYCQIKNAHEIKIVQESGLWMLKSRATFHRIPLTKVLIARIRRPRVQFPSNGEIWIRWIEKRIGWSGIAHAEWRSGNNYPLAPVRYCNGR